MSPTDLLLPQDGSIAVTEMTMIEDLIILVAAATASTSCCPKCGVVTDRIHSRYRRTVADLSACGRRLVLRLIARRFFCSNVGCSRSVFCERFPGFVGAHARSTESLNAVHRSIGVTVGGEPGARLAHKLAIPISGDTIIRRVKDMTTEEGPPVRYLGIDDFAFRRGHNYGTILIDLEQGRVLDILKSRDSSDIEAWLKAHPSVEVITRDRASAYANAASAGAPEAKQVADRWHLLKNLREGIERLLDRRRKVVKERLSHLQPPAEELDFPTFQNPDPPQSAEQRRPLTPREQAREEKRQQQSAEQRRPLTPREQAREEKRQQRVEQFERVHELHEAGHSHRQIAAALELNRETVARYLQTESFPERQPADARRNREGLREWIDRRLEEGCRNAAELHRELIEAGHSVSYYSVRRYVRRRLVARGRDLSAEFQGRTVPARSPSAKELSFTVIRKPEERDDAELARIDALKGIDEELAGAVELAIQFAAMVRGVLSLPLCDWLNKADAAIAPEMRGFARTLRQDEAAVQAGMAEPWNNGPVEGQVNRLKLIKRQMYGRAGFELLRARVRAA